MPSFEPLPKSRRRPDWRTGPNVSRGGKLIDVEILGESSIDTAGDVTLAGTTSIAPESWTAISLQNSWVDFGGAFQTARYRKTPDGTVHIQGVIKSGTVTAATLLFTLPSGYRPGATISAIVDGNGTFARYDIESDGEARIIRGFSATYTTLDFTFST